jgi:hypothetical protein
MAFLAGKFIGHVRYGDAAAPTQQAAGAAFNQPASARETARGKDGQEAMSEWTLATVYSSVGQTPRATPDAASNRRLRLRSVSRISSGEVLPGERITFLTTETIEDSSGVPLPAGARVEGVIAQATEAGEGAGRLVIEIHSLHVGGRSLALKALPVAALGGRPIRTQRPSAKAGSWFPRMDFRNPLHQAPRWRSRSTGTEEPGAGQSPASTTPTNVDEGLREAIVPQESIVEFELLALPATAPASAPAVEEAQPERGPAPSLRRSNARAKTARG